MSLTERSIPPVVKCGRALLFVIFEETVKGLVLCKASNRKIAFPELVNQCTSNFWGCRQLNITLQDVEDCHLLY